MQKRMKLAFLALDPRFLLGSVDLLARNHEVRTSWGRVGAEAMDALLAWADAAWFECCDELVIQASRRPRTCPLVCRLHGHEVFGSGPDKVNWSNVDRLVFVADHVRHYFEKNSGHRPAMSVIHNGLDMEKFRIPAGKKHPKRIASVGWINQEKNPGLLMSCFSKIHEYDAEYSLHVAGSHQDPRIRHYMERYIEENALPVTFHGYVDDVPGWLEDKGYVISTSYWESFQYSLAEGMASGLMPLIHGWPGADTLYPAEYTFQTPDECLDLLRSLENRDRETLARHNRQFIRSRYDLEHQVKLMEAELKRVSGADPGAVRARAPVEDSPITVSVIARDEEVGVKRLIDSVAPVCRINVSVDEATTDRTREVAQENGAATFTYTWKDDFSAARNEALAQVETEWVLVLDGHEFLDCDPLLLLDAIRDNPDAAGFFMTVLMEDGTPHKSIRLHRKEGAKWSNPAHNLLYLDGPVLEARELVIQHDRDAGQSLESRARRCEQRDRHLTATLEERIRSNPQDTRSMFYLGQQHRDALRMEAAHYWYERYGRTRGGNQWPEERLIAAANAGRAALTLGDPEEALRCASRAIEAMQDRAEGHMLEGEVHYSRGKHAEALEAFEKASGCPVPGNARLWVDLTIHEGGWKVMDKLSMCCWHVGEYARGAELCERMLAMEELPDSQRPRVEDNLGWHRGKLDGAG